MSRAALRMDPRYFDALVIAAAVEDARGSWAESVKYYKTALDVEPENRMVGMKYAYALAASGSGEEAAAIDEALKREDPKDFRIYLDLGVIYTSLGKLDRAEENLARAVEISPSPENPFQLRRHPGARPASWPRPPSICACTSRRRRRARRRGKPKPGKPWPTGKSASAEALFRGHRCPAGARYFKRQDISPVGKILDGLIRRFENRSGCASILL